MDQLNNLLKTQIEKESVLKYDEKCPKCGQPLYKSYNLLGKDRMMRIKCQCEVAEREEKERIEKAKAKQQRLKILMTNSLMDKKFSDCTFENWDFKKGSKEMYELSSRYVKKFSKCKEDGLGLLIYGEPGNGKTYLASCIANALLENFVPVICVSINGLLSRIQETYNKWGREAESTVIKGLCNADLLIIDDLGTERESKWSKSMVYNIIDSRYRSQLPLIITSNLDIHPKETNGILTDLYDKRTEDRIFEMCTPIRNTSTSIRLEESKKKTGALKKILYER